MRIDWKSPKKVSWIVNALLFNLCRLIPGRDKNLWVFGGREGNQYDDNSRYLFEYVNTYYSDKIHAVWLTKKEETVELIRKKGFEAYIFNSSEGRRVERKAGVAIYSHALIDFGLFPLVGGAFIVSLWHGVGFKKCYNDKYSGWSLRIKKMMDFFFSWTHRDLTIVTSEYVKKQFSGIFGLGPNAKIIIAGQPRNDIFKNNLQKEAVLKKLAIDYNRQIIIYMPTYRGKAMGADAMKKIVSDLYNNKALDEVLTQKKSIFIAKLHPLTPHIDLPNRDNFMIMDYGAIESNQELLGVSDVLITDFSSCCVDFALLGRPVIFYTPDKDEFIKNSEPIYEELLPIFDLNRCETPDELAEKVAHPSNAALDKLNEVFEDESIKGTCYSENVFKVISKEIGL